MAGYRPKSLDELNEMYDKTITAEKAIIKATKQLSDVTETNAPAEIPHEEPVKEETGTVEEFSSEVDFLINRFREENPVAETNPLKAPEPVEAVHTPEPEEEISYEKEIQALSEIKTAEKEELPSPVFENQTKPRVHYSLETPYELKSKAASKSDERTELFDDYMKIMNDDDDEAFTFKKKEKKKKHKKGLFFRHEPKAEEIPEEEMAESETSEASEEFEAEIELPAEESPDAFPVKEVIYTPEIPETNQNFKVEFESDKEESSEDEDEEFASFTEYIPAEITEEEPAENLPEEAREAPTYEEEVASHPDFDIIADESEELPSMPEELSDTTFDEFMNESDDIFSYDPSKKNTIPEYAREQYSEESEEEAFAEEYDEESEFVAPVNKKGIIAGRVILSIFLALLAVLGTGIIGINTVLGVNTGKTVFGEKFIFTATQNYTNSNILEGDLIVTEKRYANDGEVFAYINYTQQCFMFGKRNGNIVNDSGDVLFIAENDGERVLVLRDDTRGVVSATYPGIGRIVTLCTTYFIPLIAAILILGLIIVLLLSFVFKDKEKAYNKMMKKMIKKGIISAEEEAEYDFSEDTDEENLFSSIE